jgi:hypothetical protein
MNLFQNYLTRDIILSNIIRIIRNGNNINHVSKKFGALLNYRCNLPLGVAASGSGGPFCGKARVAARTNIRFRI